MAEPDMFERIWLTAIITLIAAMFLIGPAAILLLALYREVFSSIGKVYEYEAAAIGAWLGMLFSAWCLKRR
jgi:hypothetical protein